MKLCFLCNYPVNELCADYLIQLGKLLESVGNEIIIIAQTNQYIYQKAVQEELSLLPIESQEDELTISDTYRLNQALKLEEPDVLMVFNKENISAAVLLKKAALPDNAKLVFWQTEVFSEKNKGFWAGLKDSVWDSKMLKRIDLWISPLDLGNDYLNHYTSLPKEKLHHLFPQLHLQLDCDISQLKEVLNIPEDETIIGLIEDKKLLDNAINLINCVAKLRDKGYEVNGMILLSEKGIYSSKRLALYQHAIAKKVDHHIEIITKEQVNEQEFIHLSDILLIPEPSLFRTLEAFAAGTLTILSKHEASKLLAEKEELGLSSTFEAKKLAKKITEYLDDGLFADIISEKGRRKMTNKAAELKYAENLLNILSK
jgi:glycosyltransferase involved in cell wall biosynthesis